MSAHKTSLSYRDAGVDIEAGDALVDRIKPFAKRTMRPEVLGGIGGFGALFELSKKYREPVLVSGTDGVGTKLKLAFHWNKHDTVGQDLVAMSVNDILVQGAEPLFFLDYFACGKLDVDTAADVVKGIAQGCELSGCALIGGETAEMPSMYPDGEYDLAGFAVGAVEKADIIDGSKIVIRYKGERPAIDVYERSKLNGAITFVRLEDGAVEVPDDSVPDTPEVPVVVLPPAENTLGKYKCIDFCTYVLDPETGEYEQLTTPFLPVRLRKFYGLGQVYRPEGA